MTRYDDDDLITGLQHALAARGASISPRSGIGDDARRAARRRTVTRTVTAGVPVLAVAGVAAALTLSTGSGQAPRPSGAGGGGLVASTPAGPAHAEYTAYVIKRVKAKVAEDSQNGTVLHEVTYNSGEVGSDGSLTNVGAIGDDGYQYLAADGSDYTTNTIYKTDGSAGLKEIFNWHPAGTSDTLNKILINPNAQTYSADTYHNSPDGNTNPADPYNDVTPNLRSTPAEVQQALHNGHVTDTGPATVDGTPAIGLKLTVPPIDGAATASEFLFVDAQTYQPLRTVEKLYGFPSVNVSDWMPTTAANIALAQDDSIPAGYTKVANAD